MCFFCYESGFFLRETVQCSPVAAVGKLGLGRPRRVRQVRRVAAGGGLAVVDGLGVLVDAVAGVLVLGNTVLNSLLSPPFLKQLSYNLVQGALRHRQRAALLSLTPAYVYSKRHF